MGYKGGLPPGSLEARLATEIRSQLADQGHSRRWLAAQIGVPHVTVARWAKGDTAPSIGDYDAIARALGTTLVRLLVEVYKQPDVRPRQVAGELLQRSA